MEIIKEYWEGIVAFTALITAVWSAIFSSKTFKLQRIHNIKSVKPILQIGQWDYENVLSVDLRNSGSGIAVVKTILIKNKTDETKNCIYDWLPKKLDGKMNYKEYWTGYKNFIIQPGQVIKLIEIPVDTEIISEKKQREELRSILRQLTVKISYEDIYENAMKEKNMELHHFSRTDNEN
jgi:hypothetical protein